jgi:hypothetical protein
VLRRRQELVKMIKFIRPSSGFNSQAFLPVEALALKEQVADPDRKIKI